MSKLIASNEAKEKDSRKKISQCCAKDIDIPSGMHLTVF